MLQAQVSQLGQAAVAALGHSTGHGEPVPGLACFVDLAGFTSISEALARSGTAGTERLVELINRFFTPAIEQAADLGGDVVGFAGDALVVVFPEHELAAACNWALDVVRTAERLPQIAVGDDSHRLQAKVGIADGHHQTHIVGTDATRRIVTSGSAIDAAVAVESALNPGEVGVRLRSGLAPVPSTARGDVRLLTGPVSDNDRTGDRPILPSAAVADEQLTAFVPEPVISRLQANGQLLLNEHRPVTVLFIGVGDLPLHQSPDLEAQLGLAIAIIDQHGGSSMTVGSGDKGTTVLAAFGAPVAFADQRSAAVFAAAELSASLDCRVGLASGLCFAGVVGSADRWSYNLMGDVVNRAARLMTMAQRSEVLADGATFLGSDGRLQWDASVELQLKGRHETVRAASLRSVSPQRSAGFDLPLTGRVAELEEINLVLDATRTTGRGHSLALTGESGLGKTRLAMETADLARIVGFRVASLGLNRTGHRSYGPWIPVVFECLGLTEDAGPAELEAAARSVFEEGVSVATLLREIVFGSPSDNEVFAGLDPKSAAEIIDTTLIDLVTAESERPLLLVADDAHGLDEASTRLLERLGRSLDDSSVAMLIVSYPDQEIAERPWSTTIRLQELDPAEALELLDDHQAKAGLDLDPDQRAAIVEKVGGNPQLLRLLADYVAAGHGDLPADARSIVLGRFDRLNAGTRTALAMAATLGRHFVLTDFIGSFAGRVERQVLDDLVGQRLIEAVGPETLSFASPALQQVAYEAIAHATRKSFHGDVGSHIERAPAADGELRVEELAHHFGFTDDVDRHRRYFGPAAGRARRAFANTTAISWFERAIAVAQPDEVAGLRFDLGSTIEHVGRRDEAIRQFQLATGDPTVAPKALASLALLQVASDGYEAAAATIESALASAAAIEDPSTMEWILERASLMHTSAGQWERAAATAERQLEVAEGLEDRSRMAAALANCGGAKSWTDQMEGADRELSRALELAIETGALALAAEIECDLTMVALELGQIERCFEHASSARSRSQSIGHRRNEAVVLGNLALALITVGRDDEAWEPVRTALRLLIEIGDAPAVSPNLGLVAMLLIGDGANEAALGFLARVIMTGRRAETTIHRERAYELLAEIHEEMGDADRAEQCRSQQARIDDDVSLAELEAVAPMTPPDDLDIDEDLAQLLAAADRLIERLGSHDG